MRTAIFERNGHRYEVLIASAIGQECTCGVCDWRPTDPLKVISATPVTFPEVRDPHAEGHLDLVIEIICNACGRPARREVMTMNVDPVTYTFPV